jgi:hypothetical protein
MHVLRVCVAFLSCCWINFRSAIANFRLGIQLQCVDGCIDLSQQFCAIVSSGALQPIQRDVTECMVSSVQSSAAVPFSVWTQFTV